jgi:very-short-patch-repair endonuclease
MAAVLACGPGSALSHASAAALWGIGGGSPRLIDVTTPRSGRSRPGLRIHRPRTLSPAEVTNRDGIPVTTVARTVLDLAAHLQAGWLENLLDRVELRELADYPSLAALARARSGHHGAAKLLQALTTHDAGSDLTRSDLEILFRQLCKDHGLPQPRVNQRIENKEVDFLFADHGVVVETDSWRYHKTRRAFEDDRARDAILASKGYRTLRFTDRRLTTDPHAIAATIVAVLASST